MAVGHENLMKLTLIQLSKIPLTRAWANHTGVARSMDGKRIIKYGLVGSADILGISNGKFIAAEIKIGKDKQRDEQIAFQKMIESNGGLYFLIRSENDINKMMAML